MRTLDYGVAGASSQRAVEMGDRAGPEQLGGCIAHLYHEDELYLTSSDLDFIIVADNDLIP
jgi:hypothetical protein